MLDPQTVDGVLQQRKVPSNRCPLAFAAALPCMAGATSSVSYPRHMSDPRTDRLTDRPAFQEGATTIFCFGKNMQSW